MAGVQRWVDQRGVIRLAGFSYRVPIVLAGEPVEAVVADNLVEVYHRQVLVASRAATPDRQGTGPTGAGPAQRPEVDHRGGGDPDRGQQRVGVLCRHDVPAGNAWRGKTLQVCIVASSVQLAYQGTIVRVHPIRHDRAKEHGAFATPRGRPRKPRHDAPADDGLKAKPLRGRPTGRALTPSS